MTIQRHISAPSVASISRGRVGMPTASRRIAYQAAEGNGRVSVDLLDAQGNAITEREAVAILGGTEATYVEVLSDASRLEVEALYARHGGRLSREEATREQFLRQAKALVKDAPCAIAIHGEPDGSYHAHVLIPTTAELKTGDLEGRFGDLQKAWNKAWHHGKRRSRVTNHAVDGLAKKLREEAKEVSEEAKKLGIESYNARRIPSMEERYERQMALAEQRRSVETKRYGLEVMALRKTYEARGTKDPDRSLEYLCEAENLKSVHTANVRRIEREAGFSVQEKNDRSDRELFRHLTAEERIPHREAALEREVAAIGVRQLAERDALQERHKTLLENLYAPTPEHLEEVRKTNQEELKGLEARHGKEMEAVLLRHQVDRLRDREEDTERYLRSHKTAYETLLKQGQDPVRDLILERHELERLTAQRDAEARGLEFPAERTLVSLEERHQRELSGLEDRQEALGLDPEARAQQRAAVLRERLTYEKTRYKRDLADAKGQKARLQAVEDRYQYTVEALKKEHAAKNLNDTERKSVQEDRWALAEMSQYQRHLLEAEALEDRAKARGRAGADPKDIERLEVRQALEKEGLGLRRQVATLQDQERESRRLLATHQDGMKALKAVVLKRHGLEQKLAEVEAQAKGQAAPEETVQERLNTRHERELVALDRFGEQAKDLAERAQKRAEAAERKIETAHAEAAKKVQRLESSCGSEAWQVQAKDAEVAEVQARLAHQIRAIEADRAAGDARDLDREARREGRWEDARAALMERHQHELVVLEARALSRGKEVEIEDREDLVRRQEGELKTLSLKEQIDEIRTREGALLGAKGAIRGTAVGAVLDLQAQRHALEREAIAAQGQAQGKKPEARDYEALEQRQDQERAAFENRLALRDLAGEEREALRDRAHQAQIQAAETRLKAEIDALKRPVRGDQVLEDLHRSQVQILEQRHQARIEAIHIKREVARLRDREQDAQEELRRHREGHLAVLREGQDPVFALLEARHELEREGLFLDAKSRGQEEPDERSLARLEERHTREREAHQERLRTLELTPEERSNLREARHQEALKRVQEDAALEIQATTRADRIAAIEARRDNTLRALEAEFKAAGLRDQEREARSEGDLQGARERLQERHTLEQEALQARAAASGLDLAKADLEALQATQAIELEAQDLRERIEGFRTREAQARRVLGEDGRATLQEMLEARHAQERALLEAEARLRGDGIDPESAARLEVRQERERRSLEHFGERPEGVERLERRAEEFMRRAEEAREQARHAEAELTKDDSEETWKRAMRQAEVALVRERLAHTLAALEAEKAAGDARDLEREARLDGRWDDARTALLERHRQEQEAMEARARSRGKEVEAEDRADLARRQDADLRALGLRQQIEALRVNEQEASFAVIRNRGISALLAPKGESRAFQAQAQRQAIERDALEAEAAARGEAAASDQDREALEYRHLQERLNLEIRLGAKNLSGAERDAFRDRAYAAQVQAAVDRHHQVLAQIVQPTAGDQAQEKLYAQQVVALEARHRAELEALRLEREIARCRDQEQEAPRSGLSALFGRSLGARVAAYRAVSEAMERRHGLELEALTAKAHARGLREPDPAAVTALRERQALEVTALRERVGSDVVRSATNPARKLAKRTITQAPRAALKAFEKAMKAGQKQSRNKAVRDLDQVGDIAQGGALSAAQGVAQVGVTAVQEAAKTAIHQARHAAQACAEIGKGVAATVATGNPIAGAKVASEGLGRVAGESAKDLAQDAATGTKAVSRDAVQAAKQSTEQVLQGLTSFGLSAAPKEVQALAKAGKELAQGAAKTVKSAVSLDVLGTVTNAAGTAVGTAKELTGVVRGKLPLPLDKAFDLAAKLPLVGIAARVAKLGAELSVGAQAAAKTLDLDR